jgi:hypothetical protein
MDFDEAAPDNLAAAMHALLAAPVETLELEPGTAQRAAAMVAELL